MTRGMIKRLKLSRARLKRPCLWLYHRLHAHIPHSYQKLDNRRTNSLPFQIRLHQYVYWHHMQWRKREFPLRLPDLKTGKTRSTKT